MRRVFDRCHVDATGGSSRHTTLSFTECPDDLARWLVDRGADVDARDAHERTALHHRLDDGAVELLTSLGADVTAVDYLGETPLHHAAGRARVDGVRALLRHGADVAARDRGGRTPLAVALDRCTNLAIAPTSELAAVLLTAGATVDDAMRARVTAIGESFEFSREAFNPDYLADTDAGLARLYELFEVEPVPPLRRHDGSAPIEVSATTWPDQHAELWRLLVPARGAALTVQGEVVRVCGRLGREILDNGSINWDADFRRMTDAVPDYLASGTPLPHDQRQEAAHLVATVRTGAARADELSRMTELAVGWVLLNPRPMGLAAPAYAR
ncbi:ankyrin repeat domain-containing protein [Cellulomonas sp. DKR-3]|uniref:Ankyrin repeat domain-containing protein n=2 Tax=Cellulomonas fulva TaxID=2835530 RepID=A0ABS5U178_9CELL|nr:ankyrin repeat domain-containing protein [Cellulomonas fulva]